MKRYLLILILASSLYTLCGAQTAQPSPLDCQYRAGMRLGVNVSDMTFSHEPVDRYSHTLQCLPVEGLFFGMRIADSPLSIMPEVTFVQRGVRLRWLDVDYRMRASYLDLRLPLAYGFRLRKSAFAPYLMVAPTLGLAVGGDIYYLDDDDYPDGMHCDVTKADLRGMDFGLLFGAGVDWLVFANRQPLLLSLEAGYNIGLVNTFAARERYGSTPSSDIANPFFGAELWHDGRHSRGLEVALRVGIPFGRRPQDTAARDHETIASITPTESPAPPEPPAVVAVTDTVRDTVTLVDTVVVTVWPQADTAAEYVVKDCYSVAEMFAFVTLGYDISDKRACLFNVNFDFDSYNLRPESLPPINELAMMMTAMPDIRVIVYGHTDSIGSSEYNQTLSENRAQAVMEYIISRGVQPERIAFYGFGKDYPIESNETEEGRFHNRRVEFDIILPIDEK